MSDISERWTRLDQCNLCGKITNDLVNVDYSWPNFNFDFCVECAKDDEACNKFYRDLAEPYIKQQREYWSKQENIDKYNAELAEWRKQNGINECNT